MQTLIFILMVLFGATWFYLERPIYGKLPEGTRMERIRRASNYQEGKFQNIENTPDFAPGIGYWDLIKSFLNKPGRTEPLGKIPSVRTNLHTLNPTIPQLVWFGHSSYYLQADGLKVLVDPVLSGNASPVSFFAKAFDGADIYKAEDMPAVDILLLTHDHYDHLDYKTILKLKGKFKKIVTSLGVGAHLNAWGIPDEQIIELNWNEGSDLGNGIRITALPARHFSGRKFTRAQSVWSSFALKTPHYNFYLGGDSGYGNHFREIGEQYGPFNLALLECGQYNAMWPYIHMTPEETVQASKDLQAEALMPVHWAKFSLAMHSWNESVKRAGLAAKQQNQVLCTPMIGEPVQIGSNYPDSVWWDFE